MRVFKFTPASNFPYIVKNSRRSNKIDPIKILIKFHYFFTFLVAKLFNLKFNKKYEIFHEISQWELKLTASESEGAKSR